MARPKKIVETPGQEKTVAEEKVFTATEAIMLNEQGAQREKLVVAVDEPQLSEEALSLAARNAILATLNAHGAAIIARFEEYAFTDMLDHPLTNNLDFLNLVRKATGVSTGGAVAMVTNEEGKPQPVRGAPVLTENGWHVPG
ncbi:TPA: hypothetical protein RRG90_004652 [Klebsiella pneumoniae]|uniref:hypothetical protein n=1 Tax=Klebsiella pneumoniae TaxID=573 RepID=UPI000DE6EF69|nr:hypothetical protein [Klebsiella pneumoniae]SSG85620.1 Uncharacterised protein [Klebsiella pneumoniae]HBU9134793.1 hypothetical protein [Klebsiella pneumoniae]HCB1353890.1 hypothetical protein [Klebsiella pneumoniae]HDY8355802.1 hypothetical protein [Klebsiella pneumoniae]